MLKSLTSKLAGTEATPITDRGYMNVKYIIPRYMFLLLYGALFSGLLMGILVSILFNVPNFIAAGATVAFAIVAFQILARINNRFVARDDEFVRASFHSQEFSFQDAVKRFGVEVESCQRNLSELNGHGDSLLKHLLKRIFSERWEDTYRLMKENKNKVDTFVSSLPPDLSETFYRYYIAEQRKE